MGLEQSLSLAASALVLLLSVCGGSSRLYAVGLTYVDADAAFNLQPFTAINFMSAGGDNFWGERSPVGAGGKVYESNVGAEDSPQINQTVNGLTPGQSYDFYAVYWSDDDENWTISAGVNPSSLTLYSFNGNFGGTPVAGSTPGLSAAGAVWDVLPPPNTTTSLFREGSSGDPTDRLMLLGKAGTFTADGSGNAVVYFDDVAQGGAGRRSWLDGVAYVPANTPIALTASLDSATGNLTLTNPTSTPFQIKSYTIQSPAGGLNATVWNAITGHIDGTGNSSFDADPWSITAPVSPSTTPNATILGEAEGGTNQNGGTLAANGGTLNFGNVYVKSRFQDLHINLTLADNTLVTIAPLYNGAPISPADFDLNGTITAADFQTMMTNMHTNVSALTRTEAFFKGDVNGDLKINYSDFQQFRAAYEAQNGGGSFAALAGVPEPATLAMLALAGVLAASKFRCRLTVLCIAIATCLVISSAAQADPLLAVDVNKRTDSTITAPGFGVFTLTPSTTGALSSASGVVNGYTIAVTAVTSTGTPLTGNSGMDDRLRATPDMLPNNNDLYRDFIFTAAAVGVGGGIDMTITGPGLQPNKQYSVGLYSFDSGSNTNIQPRTADWLDGNAGNSVAISTSYNGGVLPTTDDQYKFTGLARTDATGKLFLRGRSTTGSTAAPGVFLNGLTLDIPIELSLEVNTSTGAVRILNEQTTNFDVAYYEIRSASGALNLASWSSFHDTNFGGAGTWLEAGGSSANILSEGSLTSMRSFASGGTPVALGNPFTPGGAQDVHFFYAAPDGALREGLVNYVSTGGVIADFNHNGTVDAGDLAVWKAAVGVNANGDADGDGDSDGADFLVWQRRLGATSATAAAGAVPEPAAALMLVFGGLAVAATRRGR
jgi:hypothetical protein